MISQTMVPLFLFICLFWTIYGYNNGVGYKPVMGWSGCYIHNTNVTESLVKNQTLLVKSSGLFDLGYTYVNIDTGWILSRDPSNNSIISDSSKFPSGMYNLGLDFDWNHHRILCQCLPKYLGKFIHTNGFKYGLYSSRGTCQCGNDSRHYSAPGSYGYYQQDAQYMATMEADYFKLDSCCHVGDLQDAFKQYKQFETYLNATNRTMYYDLCNGWYFAVNGFDYAQSYRIANDDGSFEREVSFSKIYWIGVMSGMWKYAQPFGWNNWDFLFAQNANSNYTTGKQTSIQARSQFAIYCMATSDLIISNDISNLTKYDMDTYTNTELIAIDQYINKQPPYSGYKLKGLDSDQWFIFGKPLYDDNAFVAVFYNALNKSMDIICDELCFMSMIFKETNFNELTVYDLYQHENVSVIKKIGDVDSNINGVLEMGMCVASEDQKWKLIEVNGNGNNQYLIQSTMNDGYLGTYDCNISMNMNNAPNLVTSKVRMTGNECNGDNQIWVISNVTNGGNNKNCDGVNCVQICNLNYIQKGNKDNACLYHDSIKGINSAWSYFAEDSTIREMEYCNNKSTVLPLDYNDFCRCLQLRPFVGSSLFSYTVKNVAANGGSVSVRFSILN